MAVIEDRPLWTLYGSAASVTGTSEMIAQADVLLAGKHLGKINLLYCQLKIE